MTKGEKLKAFWNKGCVPRSFMFLNRQTSPLTDQQFIDTYENYFLPGDDYGMLSGPGLIQVAKDFKLDWLGTTVSYQDAQNAFGAGMLIHVVSEIELQPPENLAVINHCSVLTAINPNTFSVWTPYQDGTEGPVTLAERYWTPKGCKAAVFRRATGAP